MMKLKFIFRCAYIAFGLSLLFISCKYDTDIAHPEDYTSIYMPQAMGNPVVYDLKMSDTAQTIIYGANYGGTGYPEGNITVNFKADVSLVSNFNIENNTSYLPMPDGSYDLETTSATIAKGKLSTKPLILKIKTNGVLEPAKKYLLPVSITKAGKDSVSSKLGTTYFLISADYDYLHLYIESGGDEAVGKSLISSATAQSINFNVKYDGMIANSDISIKLNVDTTLTDSFNLHNGTNYPSLPKGSYSLPQASATIGSGNTTTSSIPIEIKTDGYLAPMQKYLLPVRIDTAVGDLDVSKKIAIDDSKRVIYFLVVSKHGSVELTVMCYAKNSGDNGLQDIADYIKGIDPDLLVIRQLDKNTSRSGPEDQPQILSQMLGLPNYVFQTGLHYQGGEYGTAVYSKFPLNTKETKTYELPSSKSEKAPLIIVQAKVNDYLNLNFAGTHLNASESNRNTNQVPPLMNYMSNYTGPTILAGDFNDYPNSDNFTFNQLTTQFTHPCIDCATHSMYAGNYIMFKPAINFETLSYKMIKNESETQSKYYVAILKVRIYY